MNNEPTADDSSEEPTQEGWDRWVSKSVKEAPSWLVSTMVHLAIILLLALIPLRNEVARSLVLFLGNSEAGSEGDALSSFNIAESDMMQGENEGEATEDLAVTASDLSNITPDLTEVGIELAAPDFSIKKGLTGRSGTMKGALLKAYGGTEQTEQAVANGLEWLARNQLSDGSWSLVTPFSEGGTSENRPAATAMALMAFMGAGNTHQAGAYQPNVLRGLNYLTRLQDENGFFAAKTTGIQKTYAQAQATIALCELFGMTGDQKLKEPAERAVGWALRAQDDGGGWRYEPRQTGDTSVTGWYVMALISARMAGLDVPSDRLERIHQFLDTVQRKDGVRGPSADGDQYAYQAPSQAKISMTAEGMLCRMYLGWKTDDSRILQGAAKIVQQPIATGVQGRDYYYWYYATNALHHAGGASWRKWNDVMKEALPELQVKTGKERGSWPAEGDPHGGAGGRLYATVLSILCLEAYYRHMPLSEMAAR
ncbi:MAG: prenyltransferase/squalene oxidase repeat-containing protein [Pirellula sp.]